MFEVEFLMKFVKFGVVGATGVGVDFGFTYLLKEKAKMHRYLANSCGFILAASSNYFLNRIWTFHSTDPEVLKQYFSFILISLLGLGINNTFLYIFENKMNKKFYFAKLLAIGVTTFWNFGANYLYTFTT